MKLGQVISAALIGFLSYTPLSAQVQFILDLDPDTRVYTVSMLPEVTWSPPYNKTATAQITVKAPTDLFELAEFKSLTPDVEWSMNARVNGPQEAPNTDYLSFTLVTGGLEPLTYEAGVPTKLFCFKNATDCTGQVSLINNDTDPFLPPNSRSINVGNSIAVHGARGEAYTGNVSDKAFECDYGLESINATPAVPASIEDFVNIYPNPTQSVMNIDFSWDKSIGKKQILIYDSIGSLVQFSKEEITLGENNIRMDVSKLTNGIYNVLIVEKGDRITLGKIMKVQ